MINKSLIIRTLRQELKFKTDKDFAEFLGINPTTLSMWHKRNTYDVDLLINKCELFNPNWILTGNGEMLKKDVKSTHKKSTTLKNDALFMEFEGVRIPSDLVLAWLVKNMETLKQNEDQMFEVISNYMTEDKLEQIIKDAGFEKAYIKK